jgi:hypothetical protein
MLCGNNEGKERRIKVSKENARRKTFSVKLTAIVITVFPLNASLAALRKSSSVS